LQCGNVVDCEEGVVVFAEADLRALQLLLDEAVTVEVTVNDNAVETVVDECPQVAKQPSEQFHGNPRETGSRSKTHQARFGQADRRG
jgi:hypothetical protein